MWQFDRSRALDDQTCERKRWWGHHYRGTGIARIAKSLPLCFGSAYHEGAESLLAQEGGDVASERAAAYIQRTFEERKVEVEEGYAVYGAREQYVIAEALVRAWDAYCSKAFHEQFEVIEIEQEGRAEIALNLTLLYRPDGLVRERLTGDYYLVSWKTASMFSQQSMDALKVDMQSMSEVWGVQQDHPDVVIEGVLYILCVKGQRRFDKYLGFKTQSTPLAYCWRRDGVTEEDAEFAWTYEYTTEEGRSTKLGKGFRKYLVDEGYPGGVKAWIAALVAQEITPRHINALEGVFPQSLPVRRENWEIERWKRQIVSQEKRIEQRVKAVEMAAMTGPDAFEETLDREFRQCTKACFDYNSRCQFYDCCFTPAIGADPLASGLYRIRQSNHPESVEDAE